MAKAKAVERGATTPKNQVQIVARIPGASVVSVTGEFSRWAEPGVEMRPRSGDLWEATLTLAPGRYEYRLRVDGEWRDHSEATQRVPNPFGTQNCVLTVP